MEDKDYYVLDQESIDHIVASRKEVKKIWTILKKEWFYEKNI